MIPQLRPGTTLEEFYRQLQAGTPILDGRLVDIDASATTAAQTVRHGLGRAYRGGWVVVGPSSAVQLRVLDPSEQSDPATYLSFALSAATAVTARIWVY
jgi:hypothetical protein